MGVSMGMSIKQKSFLHYFLEVAHCLLTESRSQLQRLQSSKQPKTTNMELILTLFRQHLATHQMKKILFCVQTFMKITNLGLKKTKLGYQQILIQKLLEDQSCGSGDQNQKGQTGKLLSIISASRYRSRFQSNQVNVFF